VFTLLNQLEKYMDGWMCNKKDEKEDELFFLAELIRNRTIIEMKTSLCALLHYE
jgi:hypothetical protein